MKSPAAVLAILVAGSPLVASSEDLKAHRSEFSIARVTSDFYLLEDATASVCVLTGADGVLVAGDYAKLGDHVFAAIKQLTREPVRILIDLDPSEATGVSPWVLRLGATRFAPASARLQAQASAGLDEAPASGRGSPRVSYEGPVTLRFDGEAVELRPIRDAHAEGDTLVGFPAHDILLVGDYYRGIGYPYADASSGRSLPGILDALDAAIGRAGPHTKIIPAQGPMTDRGGLIAQRDLILSVRDKVAELIAKNYSLEQVLATEPTAGFDAQVLQGKESAQRFVSWLFSELTGS